MNSSTQKKHSRGKIQVLAMLAMLVAMSIICGKYLAFPVGNIMRFSFENLPVILAGIMFGPVAGAVTGVIADLVGCVLVGYTINPILTVGAGFIGLLGGMVYKYSSSLPLFARVVICVFTAHIIGSVLIKTFGLAVFYSMPLYVLMLWRALNYLIVGALECVIIYYAVRNKSISNLMLRK